MKKQFPCGHIGKGQYCHLCKERDDAYEQKRAEKRAEKQAVEQAIDVGVNMEGIPVPVAMKAADIIRKLQAGTPYMMLHGKRLAEWDRNIISVPVGWSHRIICNDVSGKCVPVEVLSHEKYNGRLSLARR
jgi:hypothetical protein